MMFIDINIMKLKGTAVFGYNFNNSWKIVIAGLHLLDARNHQVKYKFFLK